MMRKETVALTTNTAGACTAYGKATIGKLYAILYRPGDMDTGADLTITSEGDASKPLLTKADAGTSNAFFYPRDIPHAVADGAALTATAGGDRVLPLLAGRFKIVVAQGGANKSGNVDFFYED